VAKLKTVRFGIIGPGGAGRGRVRALAKDPAAKIVAAADTNPENIDKLEADVGHPVERYLGPNGYKRMIDAGGLDAVGVFSPHTLHYKHAMYALENGLHVMIEKPMVCGVGNAIRSAKLAAEKGLAYMITYQRHFEPKYVTARKLIRRGAIGEVKSFYVYMAQDWRGNGWRGDPKFSGGGQLNDSGSHYQDILLYMTGLLPKSVVGSYDFIYHGQKRPIEINGSFSVELTNGAKGRLIIIGDYIHGFTDDVRILGDKGLITFQGADLFVTKPGKQPAKVEAKVPRGYPANPSLAFVKLLTGRCKQNYVSRKAVDCAALLKKAGYGYSDLAIA